MMPTPDTLDFTFILVSAALLILMLIASESWMPFILTLTIGLCAILSSNTPLFN